MQVNIMIGTIASAAVVCSGLAHEGEERTDLILFFLLFYIGRDVPMR